MNNSYLDDFVAIDAAYADQDDTGFSTDDDYEYDADGYVIEYA